MDQGGEGEARDGRKAVTVGTTALELVREMWADLLNEAPSLTSRELKRFPADLNLGDSQAASDGRFFAH